MTPKTMAECRISKTIPDRSSQTIHDNFYLLLALLGVVVVLDVPTSKWITSPATSLVISLGLALSTTWISPMYCDQFS